MNVTTNTLDLICLGDICMPGPEGASLAALKTDAAEGGVLIANVEGALTDCDQPVAGRYAVFRAPPSAVDRLAGLDVALLANNHSGDAGPDGGLDTVRHLASAGIASVGFGRLHEPGTLVRLIERNGLTVAVINACCATANPSGFATAERPGAAPLCPSLLVDAIRAARADADAVIVCPHWGAEMHALPAPEQIALARWAVARGADAVVGHHAHVVQSSETVRGAPVFYGLGNAWFPESGWEGSDGSGRCTSKPYRISERERLSLAVTLRLDPGRPTGQRLTVVAVRPLRFEAPNAYQAFDAADDLVPSFGLPPLRRLAAARLLRRLRRSGALDYRAAMRSGRVCCWYASMGGLCGLALRCEAALVKRLRRRRPVCAGTAS